MLKAILLAIYLAFVLVGSVSAKSEDDDCGCNEALRKDLIQVKSVARYGEDYLRTVSKREFERMSDSGGFDFSVPIIKKLVLEASGSWDKFQEKRTEYLESVKYSKNSDQAWESLQLITNPISYKYWAQCKEQCAQKKEDLYAWISRAEKDQVIFIVMNSTRHEEPLGGHILNGQIEGLDPGKLVPWWNPFWQVKIKPNEQRQFVVKRIDRNNPVIFAPTAGPYTIKAIESRWGQESQVATNEFTITVNYSTPTTKVIKYGRITIPFNTPDMHTGKKGVIKSFPTPVVSTSAPGRKLRDPQLKYFGCPKRIEYLALDGLRRSQGAPLFSDTEWRNIWSDHGPDGNKHIWQNGLPDPWIWNENHTSVWSTLRVASRDTLFEVSAEEYEECPDSTPAVDPIEVKCKFGQPVVIKVPANAKDALATVKTNFGESMAALGERSKDGVLVFIDKVAGEKENAYSYLLRDIGPKASN